MEELPAILLAHSCDWGIQCEMQFSVQIASSTSMMCMIWRSGSWHSLPLSSVWWCYGSCDSTVYIWFPTEGARLPTRVHFSLSRVGQYEMKCRASWGGRYHLGESEAAPLHMDLLRHFLRAECITCLASLRCFQCSTYRRISKWYYSIVVFIYIVHVHYTTYTHVRTCFNDVVVKVPLSILPWAGVSTNHLNYQLTSLYSKGERPLPCLTSCYQRSQIGATCS